MQNDKSSYSILEGSETPNTLMSNNMSSCAICRKVYRSQNALENHLNSKLHKTNLEKHSATSESQATLVDSNIDTISEVPSSFMDSSHNQTAKIDTFNNKVVNKKREWKRNYLDLCLFCDETCDGLENNLIHMFKCHGFKIPFVDEIVKLTDLVFYLHHKLNKIKLCLFCNKRFRRYKDVARHMKDTNHMAMDVQDENPEYDIFFGIEDDADEDLDKIEMIEVAEGDEWEDLEDIEEEDEHEDRPTDDKNDKEGATQPDERAELDEDIEVSLNQGKEFLKYRLLLENVETKNEDKAQQSIAEKDRVQSRSYGFYMDFWKKNRVMDNGELLLENGHTLGHKQFRLVYKQKPVFLNMLKFNSYYEYLKQEGTGTISSYTAFNDRISLMKKNKIKFDDTHRYVLDIVKQNPYKFINVREENSTKEHKDKINRNLVIASLRRNNQSHHRDATVVY